MCAIRIGNDPVQSIGRLAKKAGEVEASQIEAQRAEERYARAKQMDFQREMAEFEAGLQMEGQKMAKQWELQKMQLASQHDFALREWEKEAEFKKDATNRIRKQDEFELIKKQINDNSDITPEQKTDMISRATAQFFGYDSSDIYGRQQGELELLQIDQARIEIGLPPKYNTELTTQTRSPIAQPVPEGEKLGITQEERTLEQQGKIKVISPEGVEGTINLNEWPEYKGKGFELYDTSMATGGQRYQQWKQEFEKTRSTVNAPIYKKGPIKYLKAKQKQADMAKQEPLAWNRYMEKIKANLQKGNQ
jgi:hypothetical protein